MIRLSRSLRIHVWWDCRWLEGCTHGPKVWNEGQRFAWHICGHNSAKPMWRMFRLWGYKRPETGRAPNAGRVLLDFVIDTRKL